MTMDRYANDLASVLLFYDNCKAFPAAITGKLAGNDRRVAFRGSRTCEGPAHLVTERPFAVCDVKEVVLHGSGMPLRHRAAP